MLLPSLSVIVGLSAAPEAFVDATFISKTFSPAVGATGAIVTWTYGAFLLWMLCEPLTLRLRVRIPING